MGGNRVHVTCRIRADIAAKILQKSRTAYIQHAIQVFQTASGENDMKLGPPSVEHVRELHRIGSEMAAIGRNLNQLVRGMHSHWMAEATVKFQRLQNWMN